MSAVYALLSFLVAVTAVVAGYRVWEKRSTTSSPESIASASESAASLPEETPTSSSVPTATLLAAPEAVPAIAQAGQSQDPVLVASVPETATAAPPIPDPWLEDSPEPGVAPAMVAPVEAVVSSPEPVSGFDPVAAEPLTPPDPTATPGGADLCEKILRLGKSGQINQVAYLTRYVNHRDSQVRSAVAKALGNLALNWRGTVVEAMIPVLGRLSQDSKVEVRLAAVEALGNIQSTQVLPWLQRAQKYADGTVRKAATTALQRLKLNYYPKPVLTPKFRMEKRQGNKRS